jgi:glucose/arabinose dehydrogenase/regulation of enolase protein 1 (concanavalin A-like superfamily)
MPPLRRALLRLLTLLGLLTFSAALPAATLPSGFTETEVASFSGSPTCMEFSPEGKLFIAQQNGVMPVWQNGSQLAANFFVNAPLVTDSSGERGLLGIAFDPNFATNRFVYVYYTISGGDHHNRVSRFTADASGHLALAGSEQIIWEGDAHSAGNHNGGAIHFGPDGKLYIATGDNASGANSQSLANQHGKILRINADGSIPLDNPFHDSTGPNRDAIWSLGLRNPFTFTFQPGTGRMFVNDVGQNTWEEINDGGTSQSGRGLNYGWPTTEGDFNQATHPGFTRPFYAYHHSSAVTTPSGNVITGGAFYNPVTNTFGPAYEGDYFFADLGSGWIYRIDLSTRQVTPFATGAFAVDLKVADDGSLYYLAYGTRKVFRVTATTVTAPLITVQPRDRTVGEGSTVTFSVDASGNPAPTFQWQRSNNGGGQWTDVNGATARTLAFTAAASDNNALFRAVATNTSGTATSNAARLTVQVNSAPNAPAIAITSGLTADGKFIAGQPVRFSGTATDPEDGTLPASAFAWTINYLTSIDQGDQDSDGMPGLTRPFSTVNGVRNSTFTPATTGPYTLADAAYAVTLTVTDRQGLTSQSRRVIDPKTSSVTLATAPSGLQLTLDGQPVTAPNTFVGVAGFQRPIGAPLSQTISGTTLYFVAWSDSGSATHTISTPVADTTFTATYAQELPDPWENADVGSVGTTGAASHDGGVFFVRGSGFIQGRADRFHFVYQEASEDCRITARVVDLPFDSRKDKNARAGVMIRADLSAGAPHLFLGPKAKGPMQMISRNRPDRATDTANAGKASAPYWVRVTREGNVLTSYRSPDGVTWTKVRSRNTITLGPTVYIGLAVCSDEAGLQNATFDNVTTEP